MAQYFEDWSGSTLNAEPAGWTKRFVTAGTLYRVESDTSGHAPAGRRLLIQKSAVDRAALSFDAVSAVADVQVRILARSLVTQSTTMQFAGAAGRIAGAAGSETVVAGNFAHYATGSLDTTQVAQINAGTFSQLKYGTVSSWTTTGYYWITLTLSGGTATVTIADVATPETIIETISSAVAVTGAGLVGFFASNAATVVHVLAVGVGTDGDPAPYSASSDTTAPTLTSPTASATGSTTASGSVTTNEANGTLYYLASANATELVATVKAGSSQAVTAVGVQNVTLTGLTASTSYYLHFAHTDAAANNSAVETSAQFTTDAPSGDVDPPTLTGAVTFTSITQTSCTANWPAGSDNVAVIGYEYQIGSTAGAWTNAGNNLSAAITGRTAGATEMVYVRAYDAAGLRSTPAISGEVTLLAATASVTSDEFKNNTGTLLASATIPKVWLIPLGTPDYTNLVTNGSGELLITEAGLSGDYLIVTANADGTEVGVSKATAS